MSEEADAILPPDLDGEDLSMASQMALVVESMDQVIELLCIYRDKLIAEDFSEEAAEAMVVSFHDTLRS